MYVGGEVYEVCMCVRYVVWDCVCMWCGIVYVVCVGVSGVYICMWVVRYEVCMCVRYVAWDCVCVCVWWDDLFQGEVSDLWNLGPCAATTSVPPAPGKSMPTGITWANCNLSGPHPHRT